MPPVIDTSRRTLLAALTATAAAPLTGLAAAPASAASAAPAAPAASEAGVPASVAQMSAGLTGPRSSVTLTGPAQDMAALTRASVAALTTSVLPGSPARTEVRSEGRPLAVLTTGSRTVLMTGPERTFTENKRVFEDAFDRTLATPGSWGNSPAGGRWSVFGGTEVAGTGSDPVYPQFTLTQRGAARAEISDTSTGRYALLRDEEVTDVDVRCTARFDRIPTGNAVSFALVFAYRSNGAESSTHLRARLSFTTQGEVQLRAEKLVGATATTPAGLTAVSLATGVPAGADWTVRVRKEGTRVQIKAWRTGTTEPTTWRMEFTETDARYAQGSVGVRGMASDGCTSTVNLTVSRFAITEATWANPPAVTHPHWVRLLDAPYDGTWTPAVEDVIRAWTGSLAPDALAYAAAFLPGAPGATSGRRAPVGARVLGEAGYGKTDAQGLRPVGADFHDYMDRPWSFPDRTQPKAPEEGQAGNLDCSGYVRMVYGHHMGLPLFDDVDPNKRALPRKSGAMVEHAPGVLVATKTDDGKALQAGTALQPGDLVLFDANEPGDPDEAYSVDHVGIYLGPDADGRRRFVSSRKSCDGPTMADLSGASVLDGTGTYAVSLRAVRRL
ncbi:NlpC/P60 family protein [Streptomyces sp. NPDC097619]|uniref:NlpC/P60 family protein n=1 Tax=Streptomyces sp. NPDC097619 TaxID=3157228 RepID=UPI00331809F8